MKNTTVPPRNISSHIQNIQNSVRYKSRLIIYLLGGYVCFQGFEKNARPTQQFDGRAVWLYKPENPGGFV